MTIMTPPDATSTRRGLPVSDMKIGRIETHRGGELVAGGFRFADFQVSIGEIFPDRRSVRRCFDGFSKPADRFIVLFDS